MEHGQHDGKGKVASGSTEKTESGHPVYTRDRVGRQHIKESGRRLQDNIPW